MNQQQFRRERSNSVGRTGKTHNSGSLSLTQKGRNQANRNNSTQIWKLLSFYDDDQTQANSYYCSLNQPFQYEKSFQRSPRVRIENDQIKENYNLTNVRNQQRSINKNISLNRKKGQQLNDQYVEKLNKQLQNAIPKKSISKQAIKKTLLKHKNHPKHSLQNQESHQTQQQKKQFRKKLQFQINNYLEKQKCQSRTLANSAFSKLYNRPCQQNYGHKNASSSSLNTNNLLKTHNITPHTNENNPQTYQSYQNTIRFAKRSKIDDKDKQQRIFRQFSKYFNHGDVENVKHDKSKQKTKAKSQEKAIVTYNKEKKDQIIGQKDNSNNQQALLDNKQKKTKLKQLLGSNQPNFIYRQIDQNGQTRVFKDRHGATCYADNTFSQNQQALLEFEKNINPILPQKVKNQDLNIDTIRRQNHKKSVEQYHPGHYLIPCVQNPYDKSRYSFRKNRAISMQLKISNIA